MVLVSVIAQFLDDVLQNRLETPEAWRQIKLRVIFKKGEPELPANYRPISIIPVLAKLYSTILYLLLGDLLETSLSDGQFGFRPGRGCADAVHILRSVIEKSAEWGEGLWIATLYRCRTSF
jgi:hypothetical protein